MTMSIKKLKSATPRKLIMFGLDSCEHDISIITACLMRDTDFVALYIDRKNGWFVTNSILTPSQYATMDRRLFLPCTLLPNSNMLYAVRGNKLRPLFAIECALLCFHGNNGEDGAIQGLLTLANIPYSGSNVLTSSCLMCKIATKRLLASLNYNIVDYITINSADSMKNIQDKVAQFGYPIIVKPATLGSSIGITQVLHPTALTQAISLALSYDNQVIIERALLDYQEINCAILRNGKEITISTTEKPIKAGDIYSFTDKYLTDSKLNITADNAIDDGIVQKIKQTTHKLALDLNISGVARVDYLVTVDNIYVNEINTIPGSLAYHLFADKFNKRQFLDCLVQDALNTHKCRNALVHTYNSSVLDNSVNFAKK